jgi:hypothetical protein
MNKPLIVCGAVLCVGAAAAWLGNHMGIDLRDLSLWLAMGIMALAFWAFYRKGHATSAVATAGGAAILTDMLVRTSVTGPLWVWGALMALAALPLLIAIWGLVRPKPPVDLTRT